MKRDMKLIKIILNNIEEDKGNDKMDMKKK
jgi:hypothetical protein